MPKKCLGLSSPLVCRCHTIIKVVRELDSMRHPHANREFIITLFSSDPFSTSIARCSRFDTSRSKSSSFCESRVAVSGRVGLIDHSERISFAKLTYALRAHAVSETAFSATANSFGFSMHQIIETLHDFARPATFHTSSSSFQSSIPIWATLGC